MQRMNLMAPFSSAATLGAALPAWRAPSPVTTSALGGIRVSNHCHQSHRYEYIFLWCFLVAYRQSCQRRRRWRRKKKQKKNLLRHDFRNKKKSLAEICKAYFFYFYIIIVVLPADCRQLQHRWYHCFKILRCWARPRKLITVTATSKKEAPSTACADFRLFLHAFKNAAIKSGAREFE